MNGPYDNVNHNGNNDNGTITDNTFGSVDTDDVGDGLLHHHTNQFEGIIYNDIIWRNRNPIDVNPNTDYVFTYYTKDSGVGVKPNLQVQVDEDESDGPNAFLNVGASTIVNSTTWIKVQVSFTTGATTDSLYMAIFNNLASGGGNDFDLDQLSLGTPNGLDCSNDFNNDGITDNLDIDSDGDGCPDALEGNGGFTAANIQNDTLTGA